MKNGEKAFLMPNMPFNARILAKQFFNKLAKQA